MEFFRIINVNSSEDQIQKSLVFENLEEMSTELFVIGDQNDRAASIGSIWGEFTLVRSEIKGGLRFALQECPNALAWSVTTGYPPAPESIVIHLTINRQEKGTEFLEEVKDFLDDQCECLEQFFSKEENKKE